ncbi:MAG: aminotransferase class V-fold PLP-dependent enzyme, partial [Cellvibrionaceae bacterium]|nr:aminotransferase class V-fold PLP-dependent enzyme [Cellvibrionaceae bacterium]
NLMALWVARNRFLGPHGVADEGVAGALLNSGYKGLAILVSERGHYSLSKAADVLGLGRNNLRSVAVDSEHRMDLGDLQRQLDELAADNIKVLAIVAVAGATETGSIDPLAQLAAIAKDQNCHFHVDGAWGGAAIFSAEQRLKLAGIELADSITLDAHKQLYTPMGAGMVLFRSPDLVNVIKHHASYIIRSDSKDLGAYTLEGSRPAMALLLHAGLHLIGSRGYGALIDHSVRLAKDFAQLIDKADDFELMLQPELNILVYRYIPTAWTAAVRAEPSAWVEPLNRLTKAIQIAQAAGKRSFVSRTKLHLPARSEQDLTVFRVVLANPKTQLSDLQGVLSQQRQIAEEILAAGEFTQYPQAAAGEEN